jgi:hypothetical protein
MPLTPSSKESTMEQRRSPPGGGDPAVMAEYFETMRHFLETQERVIATYLGADASGVARALPRPRSQQALPLPRYAEPDAWSPRRVMAAEPVATRRRQPRAASRSLRRARSRARTGQPRRARPERLNGVNGAHGVIAVNGSAKEKPAVRLDRGKLTDMLLAIIEEKTGYPRDMVGLDQSLESDLGIDSIKRIEVRWRDAAGVAGSLSRGLERESKQAQYAANARGHPRHGERGQRRGSRFGPF